MEQLNLEKMNKEIISLKREMARMKAILEDDLEFARRTEEAWERHDRGEFTSMDGEEFLKEIKKW